MRAPRTLRGRLAALYAAVLAATLLAFAASVYFLVEDEDEERELAARISKYGEQQNTAQDKGDRDCVFQDLIWVEIRRSGRFSFTRLPGTGRPSKPETHEMENSESRHKSRENNHMERVETSEGKSAKLLAAAHHSLYV